MHLPYKTKLKYIAIIASAILIVLLPFKGAVQNLLTIFSSQLSLSPTKTSKKIEELKKKNLTLKLQLQEFNPLSKENETLRKAFDFKKQKELNLQGAEVLAFTPSNWRRLAIINVGENKSIEEGQLAIDEEGNLLGKILEVNKKTSRLILVNDPGFNLSVFVGKQGYGLLKGNITNARILYIEDGDKIRKGDKVWVKTADSTSSVKIGKIKRIRKSSNSLFWDVDAELALGNNTFHKVFIIK